MVDKHSLEPVLLGIVEQHNSTEDFSVVLGTRKLNLLQNFAVEVTLKQVFKVNERETSAFDVYGNRLMLGQESELQERYASSVVFFEVLEETALSCVGLRALLKL
jgi:hypothetical protein